MSHNPTEMTLYLQLDLDESPPTVFDVGIGTNMNLSPKPGLAVLVTVDAGSLSDSGHALAGLIRTREKYAWVRSWNDVGQFLSQYPLKQQVTP